MNSLASGRLALALLVAACTNTAAPVVQETRSLGAGNISPGEAVTVVRLLSSIGNDVAGCVGRSIHEDHPGVKVVSPAAFRDRMFPWFEPGTTPTTVDGLAKLMARPAVKQRVGEFGVRYVIAVGGESSGDVGAWGVVETLGPGVALGAGFVATKESTRLNAVILDLEQTRPVGEVSASASGGRGIGLIFIIPFYVGGPDTEEVTCKAIAKRVVALLKGESRHNDQPPARKKP